MRFTFAISTFFFFFLRADFVDFSTVNSAFMHCSRIHKHHFSVTFSLKMGFTVLFTHLKIILLQCFQFSIFNFNKINSIQTDPYYLIIELFTSVSIILCDPPGTHRDIIVKNLHMSLHYFNYNSCQAVRALALGNCNAILFYNSKNHFIIYTILFYNSSTSQTSIFIKILFFNLSLLFFSN